MIWVHAHPADVEYSVTLDMERPVSAGSNLTPSMDHTAGRNVECPEMALGGLVRAPADRHSEKLAEQQRPNPAVRDNRDALTGNPLRISSTAAATLAWASIARSHPCTLSSGLAKNASAIRSKSQGGRNPVALRSFSCRS